ARNMPGNQAFLRPSAIRIATASDRPARAGRTYTSTMPAADRVFQIAHISDLHCGGPHFMPSLMDRAIGEINDLAPDIDICPGDPRIFVLHHQLLPVPGTGRERNVVYDAGDAIECLQRAGVDLVLSGHKHVPYAWKLEDLFVVNTGTVSSLRLRGNTRPCYNLIEVTGAHVAVWGKYPFHGQEKTIQFSTETLAFEKYT